MATIGGKREGAGRKPGIPNKATAEIKSIAQNYGQEAIEKLVKLMRDGESHQVQASAAKELLDRGYGRPAQAVELAGKDGGPMVIERVIYSEPEPGR